MSQFQYSVRGYMHNVKETADTILEGGWLRTGDLGYLDSKGYLYIYGRLKELIKYKGQVNCRVSDALN